MTPRTAIREHLRAMLIQAGAWGRNIYVERSIPIDDDDDVDGDDASWPNICIFTPREVTIQTTSTQNRKQEATLHIEVRVRREPDMTNPANTGMDGGVLAEQLDDLCEVIRQIVLQNFNSADVCTDGETVHFYPISEINTDTAHSAEGAMPHMMAIIEFKLNFDDCFYATPPKTCPLERFFGTIAQVDCSGVATPQPVPARVLFTQPDLGNC